MKSLLKIAGVGTLALLATVFVLSRQATATEGPGCAPTTGFIPQFCVNMPVGTSVRYRTRSGETLDELVSRLTGNLALHPTVSVGTAPDSSGNLPWTLSAFAPNSDVQVRITRNAYDLAYTVRTDAIGLYRGTFGSTAALGAYTLSADTASVHATATIDTTPAGEPDRAVSQDRSMERAPAPEVAVAPIVIDPAVLRASARSAAVANGIDPNIFERQINAESAFDPSAVSNAGAVGIAQILPSWHPNVDPTDPYASLDYAARLMRGYLVYFGSYQKALVAYDAGPGRLMPGNPSYFRSRRSSRTRSGVARPSATSRGSSAANP